MHGDAAAGGSRVVIEAPLDLHHASVPAEWLDYNGHMTESAYLLLVGDAADAFFRHVGIDDDYRAAGHSLYTAETHLHHLREAGLDDVLHVPLQLLDLGPKSLHLFHTVLDPTTGLPVATAEQLLVHVDTASGQVVAMPEGLHDRLTAIRDAHAGMPTPEAVGHVMGIRRSAG
jgi:carnitine 3-dehydrogenase